MTHWLILTAIRYGLAVLATAHSYHWALSIRLHVLRLYLQELLLLLLAVFKFIAMDSLSWSIGEIARRPCLTRTHSSERRVIPITTLFIINAPDFRLVLTVHFPHILSMLVLLLLHLHHTSTNELSTIIARGFSYDLLDFYLELLILIVDLSWACFNFRFFISWNIYFLKVFSNSAIIHESTCFVSPKTQIVFQ